MGSGPILISPESAPAIKAGARTGLSVVVCGVLFLLSTIFCPLFATLPKAATSPVLLIVGLMMFENASRVNWASVKESLPVFTLVVFIPFTYSIFIGIIFGFAIYITLAVFTGDRETYWRKIKRCCSCLKSNKKPSNQRSSSMNGIDLVSTIFFSSKAGAAGVGGGGG